MLLTRSLLRIAQFGFIKAFPGLVNIALIPALYEILGSEDSTPNGIGGHYLEGYHCVDVRD